MPISTYVLFFPTDIANQDSGLKVIARHQGDNVSHQESRERIFELNGLTIGTIICSESFHRNLLSTIIKERPDLILQPCFAEGVWAYFQSILILSEISWGGCR